MRTYTISKTSGCLPPMQHLSAKKAVSLSHVTMVFETNRATLLSRLCPHPQLATNPKFITVAQLGGKIGRRKQQGGLSEVAF